MRANITRLGQALLAIVLLVAVLPAAAQQAPPLPPQAQDPGAIRLHLPAKIYAVPGIEANVYFDNIVLVPDANALLFDVICAKGIQQAERWAYTPKAEEVGTYPIAVEVRDGQNAVVARAESVVQVVAPDAGAGKKIAALLVGDSLTHASIYPARLLDLFGAPGNPGFALVGSFTPDPAAPLNRHEGYGGWRASTFATKYTGTARTGEFKERGSPFLYENADGTKALDFARYCQDVNGGAAPDFVTFFLGCNDTFGATDANLEATIDDMFANLDGLVAMVRKAAPAARIGLIVPVPPAASQDAFAANYECGQTRWQYKRNQHRVLERMTEHYGAREAENIWIVPAFVNLDCAHNYPVATAPWNAHSAGQATRQNNGVHPAPEGYRQIGDSIYGWMKATLAAP